MDALNAADWLIISVVGVSALLSLMRGFIKEALSLIGWLLAFFLAIMFSERLALLLQHSVQNPAGRYILAFAILFVATLIAMGLLAKLLHSLIEFAGLGALDRVLGMVFGFARGVLIVLAGVVTLRPALGLDRYPWWGDSLLLPHLLLMESGFHNLTAWLNRLLFSLVN